MTKYMGSWPNKDPDDKLHYDIDWSIDMEAGDTIVSSVWTIVSGSVTKSDESRGATGVKLKLSGGTDGETCYVNNHSVLASGDELDGTMRIDIRSN